MTLKALLKLTTAIGAYSLLAGCASVYQANQFDGFEKEITQGDLVKATNDAVDQADVDTKTGKPTDLLWTLQAGSLLRMEKDYKRSTEFFDASEDMMYKEDTKNASVSAASQVGSVLVNDTILPYKQTHFDGIMANTYKAMNFSALNDINNARIEWNRVDDRQRRAVEEYSKQIAEKKEQAEAERKKLAAQKTSGPAPDINASVKQSNAILARQGIDMNTWKPYAGYVNPFTTYMHGLYFLQNAQDRSDYQRAYESLKRAYALTGNKTVKADMDIARQVVNGFPPKKIRPRVWVIFENGLSAEKDEFRIDLPIVLSKQKIIYTGIALPKLVERQRAYQNLDVDGVKTTVVGDMDKIIKAEFKEEFTYILIKELARATLKTYAQQRMNKTNPTAGALMTAYQLATTSADIRSWTTLPKEFQVARIKRPANGSITLSAPGMIEPLNVEINKDSQFNIVYVKAVSAQQTPSIEIISI
ncbi:hypothetical protein M3P05_15175 [Sansalvadorimonas sp. 2012CJ34-2]|uniref:Lipoprotein n=1 Tax=Parendozoicomonas callyspongiae TaxID=2942213 RepID=A0ABT0PKL4_9GAMM|nr:hypothetical protein [Sansalvadorimonas sp. 2012CJ34-2]MCL6271267.1 hypothetical protein [Sansalvadorimonas sp. 2012CJ34-2]